MSYVPEIAGLLHTDSFVARQFAERVQALLIGKMPSFKVIADTIRALSDERVSPEQVADDLRKSGYGTSVPRRSKSARKAQYWSSCASAIRVSHISNSMTPTGRYDHAGCIGGSFTGEGGDDFEVFTPTVLSHDPKEATVGMNKCPHGVLMIRPCAICKRGTFSDWD